MIIQSFDDVMAALTVATAENTTAKAGAKPAGVAYNVALAAAERALLEALNESGDNANALADAMTAALDAGTGKETKDNARDQRRSKARHVATFREQCAGFVVVNPDKGLFAYALSLYDAAKEAAKRETIAAPYFHAAIATVADAHKMTDAESLSAHGFGSPQIVAEVNAAIDAAIFRDAFEAQVAEYLACPVHGGDVSAMLYNLLAARDEVMTLAA